MKMNFTKIIFTYLFLVLSMPMTLFGKSNDHHVDFNYPQDVGKIALTDLKKALASHDGETVVDALVRYSLAQSVISEENMPDIMSRIDATLKQESRPEFQAIITYFKAILLNSYRDRYVRGDRHNPTDEPLPDDYSEWDNAQFNRCISDLVKQALSKPDALRQVKVTSLPAIIKCDELGATYEPTLLEFLSDQCHELLDDVSNHGTEGYETTLSEQQQGIMEQWIDATQADVPAHIYALRKSPRNLRTRESQLSTEELYERYRDNEHSYLLLEKIFFGNDKKRYDAYQDYRRRFPKGIYHAEANNEILDMEEREVYISYPDMLGSRDKVELKISYSNVNQFMLNVFRVPDELLEQMESYHTVKVSELTPVATYPVTTQGTVPFDGRTTQQLPALPPGAYVILPSFEKDGKRIMDSYARDYNELLRVSDLTIYTSSQLGEANLAMAIDRYTGQPVAGVKLTGKNGRRTISGTTNAQGYITIPDDEKFAGFTAQKGDDRYGGSAQYRKEEKRTDSGTTTDVFTDLGVYRPGETVHFAIVRHQHAGNDRRLITGEQLTVIFSDHNDEGVDTLTVTTDAWGRAEGSFAIPTDRMNGQWNIRIKNEKHQVGYKYVNVSEYKTPTFTVSFPQTKHNFTAGQPVKLQGHVETYSGMPIANTEVKLSLFRNEWSWWWWGNSGDTQLADTTVTTDAQGDFTIVWDDSLFPEKAPKRRHVWAMYSYSTDATCTDAAGETQSGTTSFIVGTRRGISFSEDKFTYVNDKPIKLPLSYNTTDEENPSTLVTYEIINWKTRETVLTGNLNTADPTLDLTRLPSGQYLVKAHILDAQEGEQDIDAEALLTLYLKNDKQSPVDNCPLWLPESGREVDKNNLATITIGTSTPEAHIYYIASAGDRVIKSGWLDYAPGMHRLQLQIPNERDVNLRVKFITTHNGVTWEESISMRSPVNNEALRIKVVSFRDKLTPGEHEHWSFQLLNKDQKPWQGAMLLEMYDKAISTIAPNDWRLSTMRYDLTPFNIYSMNLTGNNRCSSVWKGDRMTVHSYELPELYLYDQMPFSFYVMTGERRMMRGMAAAKGSVVLEDVDYAAASTSEALIEMKQMESASNDEMGVPIEKNKNLDQVSVRQSDIKTALWQPMLTTDQNGNVSVEFVAPQFNTTWLVQGIAYTHDVYTDQLHLEVLTQKPLMVKSNMPRFLRQGDQATLTAQVQNATDQATVCDAMIELFNPRTNEIYASRTFNESLAARGSNPVSIQWTVPDSVAWVGFRVRAANDNFGDGEQVMVPVLTTISPVIETQPFYIEAAQSHFEQQLPQFPSDARVTLEYCDNPTWYCVTALPTIYEPNYFLATSLAHNLFAMQVAQGVAKSQPLIREAVTYWKEHDEDSTLVSMLQKNQDLKIGTLLASPWLRDAEKQTLRMSKLNELFDEALMKREYEKIITTLQEMQNSDGGWPWYKYPGCRSSEWTTGVVLEIIGEIKHLGYLPDDNRLDQMVKRACAYYDAENLRLLKEALKYNKNPYKSFSGYAYVRTLFPEVETPRANRDMLNKVLKAMSKEWTSGLTLSDKAFYAMTLNRNGYQKVADKIVESIRQFAIVKPSLGMYWDNLQTSRWLYVDKVAVTSTILQALNEIDPRQQEIDQVRKWMLLMKQSNDWGSISLAADAVYSLLLTGSQWLERNPLPSITVAGTPLQLDDMAGYTGYFRTTLPNTASGAVVVERSGNSPAWGAVYSQFHAPMTEIKEQSIEEISISKEYYVYADDGTLHSATTFHVGDKVQVRTVIKTNKDMDYVTVTDERAACFEPVDQLSGYRHADWAWYYHETKDSQTNLFFDDLQKGTHVISYDVRVTAPGTFTSGIATIQCQYAPQLTAHSAGKQLKIDNK